MGGDESDLQGAEAEEASILQEVPIFHMVN